MDGCVSLNNNIMLWSDNFYSGVSESNLMEKQGAARMIGSHVPCHLRKTDQCHMSLLLSFSCHMSPSF